MPLPIASKSKNPTSVEKITAPATATKVLPLRVIPRISALKGFPQPTSISESAMRGTSSTVEPT